MTSDARSSGTSSKAKIGLIALVVALIVGAGLYFFGLQSGKAQLVSQRTQFEQREQKLQSDLQGTQSQLEQAREREALLRAQTQTYQAAIALEKLNFGTANGHLQRAAQELRELEKAEIGPLRERIAATELGVAADVGQQRAQVLDFATQLSRETPLPTPDNNSSATAPAPDTRP